MFQRMSARSSGSTMASRVRVGSGSVLLSQRTDGGGVRQIGGDGMGTRARGGQVSDHLVKRIGPSCDKDDGVTVGGVSAGDGLAEAWTGAKNSNRLWHGIPPG